MSDSSQYFMSSSNDKIAYKSNGLESDTTIFFFGGYASSMTGTKATSLRNWTLKKNLNFSVRCGQSVGNPLYTHLHMRGLSHLLIQSSFYLKRLKKDF